MDDGAVSVQLSGLDKFLSFHGALRIPFDHIIAAHAEDQSGWDHMWTKLVGTSAPGLKMAGTFWIKGGLAFLDYGTGLTCLVIETKSETYKRIIVQPDPGEDAAALAAVINKKVAA